MSRPITSFRRDRQSDAKLLTLEQGLYLGVVVGNSKQHNSIVVSLEGYDRQISCSWAAGIISGLLGFKTRYTPPDKTRVLVYYTQQETSFIVGSLNTTAVDPVLTRRAAVDPDGPDYADASIFAAQKKGSAPMSTGGSPIMDLAEGELMIENLMGVSLQLLTHFAALSAGDRAKVETHLMDDMVRIISGVFRHHSAFGDLRIYNDGGRLNMEQHGSTYDHEAYGNLSAQQARVKMDGPEQPNLGSDSQIDGFTDEGRWRLSQYCGWLGDFINLWVTDPAQTLGRLAQDQLRAGKFRCHVNSDGTCLVQSVSEICLEKVVRIPVPVRIRREDDPEGNRSDGATRVSDANRQWKPSDQLFEMAFQLREYARWLSNTWSLGRFHQMDLDFKVPTEEQTPRQDPNSQATDRHAQNGEAVSWREVYSCIRILRDGSIMTVDGYGNSITTTATGVIISAVKDLRLEAGGSIVLTAGRDLNLTARRNVNITAVLEAVRIKSEGALMFLSTIGRCVFDLLSSGWLTVRNGGLNVNGVASIDSRGTTDVAGSVTALKVSAVDTCVANEGGDHPHMNHLYFGSPRPYAMGDLDRFAYQGSYAAGTVYQSLTQSMMARGEVAAGETWNFSDNQIPDRGAPWPGASPQQKTVDDAGDNLSQPATTHQKASPSAMTMKPATFKTQ